MTQELLQPQVTILIVPIENLVVPLWNPRKYMAEGPLQDLIEYIRSGETVDRLLVYPAEGPQYHVISGQRRLEAFRRLGWERVEVEVFQGSLEKAKVRASTSNEGEPVFWLDRYENWMALKSEGGWSQREASARLGRAQSQLSLAENLMGLLNEESKGLIRQSLGISSQNEGLENKGNLGSDKHLITQTGSGRFSGEEKADSKNWELLETVALKLLPLAKGRNILDAQDLAYQALQVMITGKFNGPQTDQLVAHLASGKKAEEFQVKTKVNHRGTEGTVKAPEKVSGEEALSGTGSASSPQAGEEGVIKTEVAASQTDAYAATAPRNDSNKGANEGSLSNLLLNEMAGNTLVSKIKGKLKKGEKLTPGEMVILTLHSLAEVGVWTWKHLLKPGLMLLKRVGLWLARNLWHWAKAAAAGFARFLGGTANSIWRMIAPVLFVILVAVVLWNWGVNHVSPGEQLGRLGAWTWGKVVSVLPFHESPEPVTAKPQEPAMANQQPEIPTSATADPSTSSGQVGSAPRDDSGNSNVGQGSRNDHDKTSPPAGTASLAPPAAKDNAQPKAQGDALSQAGDAVGKATGGIGAAKKLFGL